VELFRLVSSRVLTDWFSSDSVDNGEVLLEVQVAS